MGRKILFVTTDQQRYDTLGCNGGTLSRTPVVDSLAAEGVRTCRHRLGGGGWDGCDATGEDVHRSSRVEERDRAGWERPAQKLHSGSISGCLAACKPI